MTMPVTERTHQFHLQNCFPGNPTYQYYSPLTHWWCHKNSCCLSRTLMHWLLQLSLGWSPSVRGRQTSERPKQCSPSCSPCTSACSHIPVLRHLHWLPVRSRISYKTAGLCLNAITSSTPACLSDLLHLYSPSQSLRSSADTRPSKFHSIRARQKVILLSLTLVLLSGTHCHCTLEMLQLSTPSSLL